jgi:hypothetical protein
LLSIPAVSRVIDKEHHGGTGFEAEMYLGAVCPGKPHDHSARQVDRSWGISGGFPDQALVSLRIEVGCWTVVVYLAGQIISLDWLFRRTGADHQPTRN